MALRTALLLTGLAALLLAPSAASAATARIGPGTSQGYPVWFNSRSSEQVAHYDAGSGEANRLLVTFGVGGPGGYVDVTFHDPNAVIHAGDGCTTVDSHTAHCQSGENISRAEARLRDRGDEVRTTRPTPYPLGGVDAFGGPGDDTLDGGAGADLLDGGGGRDELLGGASEDVVTDGDVSGVVEPEGPGRDAMDGGPGEDILSYRQRRRAVRVDLRRDGPAGEEGENDTAGSFESVIGGSGRDRIDGNDEDNILYGRGGRDTLVGRGGDDELVGGPSRDRLHANDGDDTLTPGSGRDFLSCGTGRDRLEQPVAGEVIGRCESAAWHSRFYGDLTLRPRPVSLSRRFVSFRIPCPDTGDDQGDEPPRCAGALAIRTAFGRHRLLGRVRIDSLSRPNHVFRIRLTKLGRRLVRRRRGVTATISLRDGNFPAIAWTLRLGGRR